MPGKLYVVISLDVEEEGLFSGRYANSGYTLANVPLLRRLLPLTVDLGFPLTLFCAWSVFANEQACATVKMLVAEYGAEAGAHLHHWSTPPLRENEPEPPERSHRMQRDLLEKRLQTLLEAGRMRMGKPLVSFRMGRWDLKASLLPLLARAGIRVDSSICPLRIHAGGADHFLAPADPYWVDTDAGPILEAPITQVPLAPFLPQAWRLLTGKRPRLQDKFHFFGALSPNPVWHGTAVMRLAARLHARRGGRVLNFFLHSSELMPGASPNIPDQKAADALVNRIFRFCEWLASTFDVEPITASKLADLDFWPQSGPCAGRDW